MARRSTWMLYGASGFSGSRIARKAVALGQRPVLAGRNGTELKALAGELGLDYVVITLDDSDGLHSALRECSCVMHCAGPFAQTSAPMIEACLAAGTHYLDITGEVPVYEALAARDSLAREAGIMMLPGCGFDMVPSDCLALTLKRWMPDATELDVAVSYEGTLTHGTIRSALVSAAQAPSVRRAHRLEPLGQPLSREFDFGPEPFGGWAKAHAVSLGDVSIAWRTTGIPDVTVYLRPAKSFAALAQIRNACDIDTLPEGPSPDELEGLPTVLIGEVRNAAGEALAARMTIPQIYAITFDLAAGIAQRVHQGALRRGFQTPASLFGEDFMLQFEGCTIEPWMPASRERLMVSQ